MFSFPQQSLGFEGLKRFQQAEVAASNVIIKKYCFIQHISIWYLTVIYVALVFDSGLRSIGVGRAVKSQLLNTLLLRYYA